MPEDDGDGRPRRAGRGGAQEAEAPAV